MKDADRGGLLTEEDQGTIFMFSLVFAMAIAAVIYFTCTWYRKKKQKEQEQTQQEAKQTKTKKPGVSKTFSRFSQVDEELTVHMGALDDVDDDEQIDDDKSDKTNTTHVNMESENKPPYLETDM